MSVCVRNCPCPCHELPLQNASIYALNLPVMDDVHTGVFDMGFQLAILRSRARVTDRLMGLGADHNALGRRRQDKKTAPATATNVAEGMKAPTPLMLAVWTGSKTILQLLLARGAQF